MKPCSICFSGWYCHHSDGPLLSLQSAQQATQAAAEAVGLRLKPLDKKAEKALVQAQQDDLQAQLADHTDPAAVLSLVVPLLVMQVSGCNHCCALSVLQTILQPVPLAETGVAWQAYHLSCTNILTLTLRGHMGPTACCRALGQCESGSSFV